MTRTGLPGTKVIFLAGHLQNKKRGVIELPLIPKYEINLEFFSVFGAKIEPVVI